MLVVPFITVPEQGCSRRNLAVGGRTRNDWIPLVDLPLGAVETATVKGRYTTGQQLSIIS